MTESISKLGQRKNFPDEKNLETQHNILQLLIFQCLNRTCELEFPAFEKNSDSIIYCPKCKGIIVKKTGSLRVTILEPETRNSKISEDQIPRVERPSKSSKPEDRKP
jgi:hypothetical protein